MTTSAPQAHSAVVALTLGDPRGIGPEIALTGAQAFVEEHPDVSVLFIGAKGSAHAGFEFVDVGRFDGSELSAGGVSVRAVEEATRMALRGDVSAVVTGPVSKPAIRAAGWRVPGQTEMLQQITEAPEVGMLMSAETTAMGCPLRVLLATTHLPLREVAPLLSIGLIESQSRLLIRALKNGWGIARPRIALCALNPHASDGGLFGDEERLIMEPAISRLDAEGYDVEGPLPADTVFRRALEGGFDAVVAPYHDVGMAAFKTVSFGSGVNVTLGLPIVRTSPDHGTAFDIAGRGIADSSSTLEALRLAYRLANSPQAG